VENVDALWHSKPGRCQQPVMLANGWLLSLMKNKLLLIDIWQK
jgi:hypothetical protein